MSEVLKLADHAANQPDRYLFIVTLIILLVAGWFFIKYFMGRVDRLMEQQDQAREAYERSLRTIIEQQNTTAKEIAVALANNTAVLQEFTRRRA